VGGWGWNTGDIAEFYRSQARHLGVLQLGYVEDHQLPALYNGASALVFPSIYEGFGSPPIEMMACGGAVLASTAGSVVETVGRRAHLIPADDLEGWRDAMKRIVTDEDWRQELRYGVVQLARKFTWERCAEQTLEVYRQVCGLADVVRQSPLRRAA
jgi:alpha-1,3-rhamnosyl/mannosyltransferase